MFLDAYELKLLFMAIIFTATTCIGLTPMVVRSLCGHRGGIRKATRDRFLSCASCYSAGVFLFVCFLGLLPAADNKFHHFLRELSSRDESMEEVAEFPWGFFVVTCGFLFIFTIDKVVDAAEHSRKRSSSLPSIATVSEVTKRDDEVEAGSTQALESSQMNGHAPDAHDNDCSDQRGHGVPSSVIFLVALGIHSIFEGMAVGLQTEREKVLEFSVAVLVHEVVMAFSFGMEVNKSRTLGRWQKLLYVLLFTMTLPLGIGAGLGLQNAPSEHREIVSAVFEALATGIFIHVIFIEVLAKEFPEHHHHNHAPKSSKESIERFKEPSELCLMLEKIASICLGLLTLILLNVFMHSHHH